MSYPYYNQENNNQGTNPYDDEEPYGEFGGGGGGGFNQSQPQPQQYGQAGFPYPGASAQQTYLPQQPAQQTYLPQQVASPAQSYPAYGQPTYQATYQASNSPNLQQRPSSLRAAAEQQQPPNYPYNTVPPPEATVVTYTEKAKRNSPESLKEVLIRNIMKSVAKKAFVSCTYSAESKKPTKEHNYKHWELKTSSVPCNETSSKLRSKMSKLFNDHNPTFMYKDKKTYELKQPFFGFETLQIPDDVELIFVPSLGVCGHIRAIAYELAKKIIKNSNPQNRVVFLTAISLIFQNSIKRGDGFVIANNNIPESILVSRALESGDLNAVNDFFNKFEHFANEVVERLRLNSYATTASANNVQADVDALRSKLRTVSGDIETRSFYTNLSRVDSREWMNEENVVDITETEGRHFFTLENLLKDAAFLGAISDIKYNNISTDFQKANPREFSFPNDDLANITLPINDQNIRALDLKKKNHLLSVKFVSALSKGKKGAKSYATKDILESLWLLVKNHLKDDGTPDDKQSAWEINTNQKGFDISGIYFSTEKNGNVHGITLSKRPANAPQTFPGFPKKQNDFYALKAFKSNQTEFQGESRDDFVRRYVLANCFIKPTAINPTRAVKNPIDVNAMKQNIGMFLEQLFGSSAQNVMVSYAVASSSRTSISTY
jgi:hypothetical protein